MFSQQQLVRQHMHAQPFVKQFQTERNRYVYDVGTNDFYLVDDLTSNVLRNWQHFQHEYAANDHHNPNVSSAIAEVRQYQAEGAFLPSPIQGLALPIAVGELEKRLQTSLSQLILNVTERCNLRCSYCVFSGDHSFQRSHSSVKMSTTVAIKAVEYFLAHSSETREPCIGFYGGEPLLHFALIRAVVEYVEQKYPDRRVRYQITTNGTLLAGDTLAFLANRNFFVVISIDGPPHIHDNHRHYIDGRGTHGG
jgi:uncharacterized protein